MSDKIRCPYCGFQYAPSEGRGTCASCGLHSSCSLLRCPNCGYESPAESRLGKLIGRIWKGGRHAQAER